VNSKLIEQAIEWRHELHQRPETALKEVNTSKYIAEKLRSLGIEVFENIGGTGVIGKLSKGNSKKSVGFRADMDGLPIQEVNTFEYRSKNDNAMHACGHDGHMTMVLGAAAELSQLTDLNGTIYFLFQPAEEPGLGAKAMIKDGVFKKFPMDAIFGLHNIPSIPAGHIHTRSEGIMASEDNFIITIKGRAGHASAPHLVVDPILIGSEIVLALQSVVARSLDPIKAAVVSCTEFITDGARNAIPGVVTIKGDTRSYDPEVQKMLEKRMHQIVAGICQAHNAEFEFSYTYEFEPTINDADCVKLAVRAASNVLGSDKVLGNCAPITASEDSGIRK